MSISDLIRKRGSGEVATAIPAMPATQQAGVQATVAKIAKVAVANPPERKADPVPDPKAEARRQRVLAMLASDPGLRVAVVSDGEGDPVPVAVGIRDKGTCEVHIPAERFDPFTLLDLVDRHGRSLH